MFEQKTLVFSGKSLSFLKFSSFFPARQIMVIASPNASASCPQTAHLTEGAEATTTGLTTPPPPCRPRHPSRLTVSLAECRLAGTIPTAPEGTPANTVTLTALRRPHQAGPAEAADITKAEAAAATGTGGHQHRPCNLFFFFSSTACIFINPLCNFLWAFCNELTFWEG